MENFKIDDGLLSEVLENKVVFNRLYAGRILFNGPTQLIGEHWIRYPDPYHEPNVLALNLDTFGKLIKKWAYKKGYNIKEEGLHVKIHENEFNEGIFTTDDLKDDEIFDVKKIINAGMFILGCEE